MPPKPAFAPDSRRGVAPSGVLVLDRPPESADAAASASRRRIVDLLRRTSPGKMIDAVRQLEPEAVIREVNGETCVLEVDPNGTTLATPIAKWLQQVYEAAEGSSTSR